MILDELSSEGQNIRKNFQQRLPSNPVKDYYFIHRNTPDTEAVIVEYGFLDSTKDDVNQLKNDWKDYAEAVVRAIAKYKNIPYNAPVESNYYTVQKGDSLWSIATKYGITVDELKALNNITNNTIHVGQNLKVKAESEKPVEDYLVYTVKSGDSLWKIANSYGISVDKLKSANNLKSDVLSVGQKLLIPVSDINVEEVPKEPTSGVNYIVVSGDNLYSIANKYGVSVDDIKKENNLSSNILKIGQVLKIPGTDQFVTYTVKSGDSLWKIANTYGVTVNELKNINNLEGSLLSVGQKLLIPTK